MKRLCIYLPILFSTVILTVTLRTVALIGDFDRVSGYFSDKTIINVSNAFLISACVIFFSYVFIGRKVDLRASFSTPSTYVPTGLVAIALVFLSGRLIGYARSLSISGVKTDARMVLAIAGAILAVGSIAHFFLNAFLSEDSSELRSVFALATILFLAGYACFLYFTTELPINAPNKLVDQMAFLFAAIFFLYEARISLGRAKWRPYIAFGMISAALCAYSSIPALISFFATGTSVSANVEENVLTLTLFIFITARLIKTLTLHDAKQDELVEAMESSAKKRAAAIDESSKRRAAMFMTQLTIDDIVGSIDEDTPSRTEDEAADDSAVQKKENEEESGIKEIDENEQITIELTPEEDKKETKSPQDEAVDAMVSEALAIFKEAEAIAANSEKGADGEENTGN